MVGNDKSNEKVAQIQQVLQYLSFTLQSVEKATTTNNGKNELNSINLEQLVGVEKLPPETKTLLNNRIIEILNLIEKSKGNDGSSTQISDVLQKLSTELQDVKGDLKLLKVINYQAFSGSNDDKLLKHSTRSTSEITPINLKQSSSDARQDNKSSGNKSFEDKFLNNLLGQDKDETKISKVVNFMSQFEVVKTADTTKVGVSNITINKNNFEVDVIKNIKFMEINNIKDLIVKMNPKRTWRNNN